MWFEKLLNLFRHHDQSRSEQSRQDQRISTVIDWAKQRGYLEKLDLSEDSAESLFRSILVDHDLAEQLRSNQKLNRELKRVIVDKAGEKLPLPPEEAKRLLALVATGELLQDVYYSINVIFSAVLNPGRLSSLDNGETTVFDAAVGLSKAVLSDLNPRSVINDVSVRIEQIKKGEAPDDPKLLNETLKTIFSISEVGDSIDLVNQLLAPENETLRIALLIYARLNGVNLEQKDLDELRGTLLVRNNPRLGALLSYLIAPENAVRLAGG